jgi:hypothetical protein
VASDMARKPLADFLRLPALALIRLPGDQVGIALSRARSWLTTMGPIQITRFVDLALELEFLTAAHASPKAPAQNMPLRVRRG